MPWSSRACCTLWHSNLSERRNVNRQRWSLMVIVRPLSVKCAGSVLDPVVHVGNAGLPLDDSGALELDVLGIEVIEETSPLAEQHRDEMDLEFVEDAGRECELGGSGAVDEHVLVARGVL